MRLAAWALVVRAPFLVLPIVLSLLGTALAAFDGTFSLVPFLAFTAVLLLLHVTVNTLNEYHDHLTGIDFRTLRTPFNGGSGILQEGILKPAEVRRAAYACFVAAVMISLYLVLEVTAAVAPVIAIGMVFALFYTQFFARNLLGEVSAGLGLGLFPVLGAYIVQTSGVTPTLLLVATASALLTFNLQLLNEFPDLEADRFGGRWNLVMLLGERRAAALYTSINVAVYVAIAAAVVFGDVPVTGFLALLTVPLAYKASSAVMRAGAGSKAFIEGQKANIKMVLGTQALIVVGIGAYMLHGVIM